METPVNRNCTLLQFFENIAFILQWSVIETQLMKQDTDHVSAPNEKC